MGLTYRPLWETLEKKGLMRKDLNEHGVLSSSTIAKLSGNQSINTKTIEKLCAYLDCKPEDIIEYVKDKE
jgi:DNA-binding Xre family transcriptional regulator